MAEPQKAIWLTDAERVKFILWLHQEVKSAEGMAKLMEQNNVTAAMSQREKVWGAACAMVAQRLENTETMTLGGGSQ
jgi:hypothetical protein